MGAVRAVRGKILTDMVVLLRYINEKPKIKKFIIFTSLVPDCDGKGGQGVPASSENIECQAKDI